MTTNFILEEDSIVCENPHYKKYMEFEYIKMDNCSDKVVLSANCYNFPLRPEEARKIADWLNKKADKIDGEKNQTYFRCRNKEVPELFRKLLFLHL